MGPCEPVPLRVTRRVGRRPCALADGPFRTRMTTRMTRRAAQRRRSRSRLHRKPRAGHQFTEVTPMTIGRLGLGSDSDGART